PDEIFALRDELLYAPDRAKPETKAFEQACTQSALTAAKLFERCGKLPDSHAYPLNRLLYEFPRSGATFPSHPAPESISELPLAQVAGFSLEDHAPSASAAAVSR